MSDLPHLRPREVQAALERLGWVWIRSRGSHRIFKKPGRRFLVSLPWHERRTVPPGTLRNIVRAIEVTIEEFLRALD
jgi:predicted RNA binding protein YcfA (HicA-like mRNA interferase family)